jgi:hypothetical protein
MGFSQGGWSNWRDLIGKTKTVAAHPSHKNQDVARMGHPIFVGGDGTSKNKDDVVE